MHDVATCGSWQVSISGVQIGNFWEYRAMCACTLLYAAAPGATLCKLRCHCPSFCITLSALLGLVTSDSCWKVNPLGGTCVAVLSLPVSVTMALRKLATETTMRMGLSITPASQAPASMMGVWSRAYAKGIALRPRTCRVYHTYAYGLLQLYSLEAAM